MAKINLDELRADREAGTDGPWSLGYDNDTGPDDDYYIEWLTAGPASIKSLNEDVDARRIARLPDLEEAYIEAVELLERWIEHAVACEDDSTELYSTRLFLDHNT